MVRLVLLAALAISFTIPATCDSVPHPVCGPVADQNMPYPYDCKLYIECRDGETYYRACPPGLIYHPSMQVCTPGDYETCEFTPRENMCTGRDQGRFPVPDQQQCKEFIACSNGVGRVASCPAGTALRPRFFDCVPANEETCETYEHICFSHNNLIVSHPARCDMYISCVAEVAYIVPCRRGEVFVPHFKKDYNVCVIGSTNNCVSLFSICYGRENGAVLEHPDFCDVYIACNDGTARVQDCPYGYIFSPTKQRCVIGHALTCQEPEW